MSALVELRAQPNVKPYIVHEENLHASSVCSRTYSGSKGVGAVAFRIYDKEGSCEELRAGNPQRVVGGTKNVKSGAPSGPLQVKQLSYCIPFVSDPTDKNPAGVDSNCASGSIDFSYDAKANEYLGKYDITMKNNMLRRGEFRAQFCKPKEPAKK